MNHKLDKLTKKELLYTLPYILISFSSILVFGALLDVAPEAKAIWSNEIILDYFSYYKAKLIIFAAFISLIALLHKFITKEVTLKFELIYIPLMVYALMLLVSHLFSIYQKTSLLGFPERYEGLLVNLSYLIIFVTLPKVINKRKQIHIIVGSILLIALIVGIIGLSQFLGQDILRSEFVISTINSNITEYENFIEEDINNIGSSKGIYSTMYNSNTLGHYLAMLISFSLFLMLGIRNKVHKILLIALIVILYINLIGSYSRGSLIALFLVVFVYSLLARKSIKLKLRIIIYILVTSITIFISMSLFTGGVIADRLKSMLEFGINHQEDEIVDKIKNFSIEDDLIFIQTTNQSLFIEIDKHLIFYDEYGNLLRHKIDENTGIVSIEHKGYNDFKIQYIDKFLKIGKGKSFLIFTNSAGRVLFLNLKGQILEDYNSNYGEIGIERVGSGRGYIWSRTLPLLKSRIIIGSGIDTFAYEFPQGDYKGKLKYMYDAYIIIDKPHNIFFQIAINSGIISLISFLSLIIIWAKKSINVINDNNKRIIIAIIPAILTYLVGGTFTDSTVSVTPVFWLFMGLGRFYHEKKFLDVLSETR